MQASIGSVYGAYPYLVKLGTLDDLSACNGMAEQLWLLGLQLLYLHPW